MRPAKSFPVKDILSEKEVQNGLGCVLRDGMASQAMASLTGSAFLIAFALQLGASNALIGLLAAIPHLTQLAQIPAVYLVEKVRNRRLISVLASVIGRFSWLFIALAPFVLSDQHVLVVLLLGLFTASLLAAVLNCSWNSWMHDLIPGDQLGAFFGRRFSLATTIGVVVSLGAAFFLDHVAARFSENALFGYSIIFGTGFLMGMLSVRFISKIPEPRMFISKGSVMRAIVKPFHDVNFRNLIHFLGSWNFAIYLATPFFTVYLLKRLEMELAWVIGLIAIGRLVNIVFLRIWGGFSDRFSNKAVLAISGPLCLLCILGWTFTTMPEKHVMTIPLLILFHMLMGVAMAGITLASGNISLKLAPKGEATAYLAVVNFINAMAAGTAPLISGHLVDFFVESEFSWTVTWRSPERAVIFQTLNLQQWDFLFVLSFLAGLYAIHRLTMVKEINKIDEKISVYEIISALGREIRDFSTVATLRNIATMSGFDSSKKNLNCD